MTETSCWCGLPFSMPLSLYKQCKDSGQTFYCPLGHAIVFKETDADKFRRERDRSQQQAARLEQEKADAWATATAQCNRAEKAERAAARARKRVANGVCPCCTRSFTNLARHMKTKHPEQTKLECVA